MKEKRPFNWWIFPLLICGIIAVASIGFYLATLNMALIVLILPSIAGTGLSLYKMMGDTGMKAEGISEAGPVKGDINTCCIYGRIENGEHLADKVEYEKLDKEKLLGDRWYFEDLNRWLHVMFNDLEDEGKMKAFELPDTAYTDPARLAIQLNMGRVNELFQIEPSLFDQLKPWIMVAVIAIIGFLIFLSGSG